MNQSNRIEYLDYSRAFACILVVIGHLLMSFQDAGFIDNIFASFFRKTIYHFHVYVFIFCSGYLFQKSFTKYTDKRTYFKEKIIRCLDFAVTYVIFTFITYFIKTILSGNVNSEVEGSFLYILCHKPINQMWYLYAILFITFFAPLIRSKNNVYILLIIALCEKTLFCILSKHGISIPLPVSYLLQHQTWFLLGMIWEYKNIKVSSAKAFLLGGLFLFLSVIAFITDSRNHLLSFLLNFSGIVGTVEIIRCLTKKASSMSFVWRYLSKYMYQIYLMHTIFAAGIRIVLLKLSISNLWIHILFGLIFSFVVPVICAMVAEKITLLNIVFFPSKTIAKLKKNN